METLLERGRGTRQALPPLREVQPRGKRGRPRGPSSQVDSPVTSRLKFDSHISDDAKNISLMEGEEGYLR